MNPEFGETLYTASTWVVPVILAITLHEAAHGYAARLCGDNTAWVLGRVTLNPLKHVDPFGTIILPAMLLLMRAPFLFGYAKPVPVNFRALRHPKRDMVWVAGAGPAMNIALATIAAFIMIAIGQSPLMPTNWVGHTLFNAVVINVILAIFNMIPIPPLDGGRIAVGLLPEPLSRPLAELEPYGFLILIVLLIILPTLGPEFNVIALYISYVAEAIINGIFWLAGNR